MLDGLLDPDRIGTEGCLVQPGGDGDPKVAAVHHLGGQGDRGPGECGAVGHEDDPDCGIRPAGLRGYAHRGLPSGHRPDGAATASAAARSSKATVVAPGS